MFLHVGADVVVSLKRVVAILDLKSSMTGESTRDLLHLVQRRKNIVDIANGDPKSLILTDAEAYLSPISSLTLMKRAAFMDSHIVTELDL